MKLFIGIDLGKASHVGAFLSQELLTRHKRYSACPTLPIPNTRAGFDKLRETIEKYSTPGETCVLLERTGHYGVAIIQFLQEYGIAIYRMQVRKRHGWDKTDVKDAQALSVLLYNTVAMNIPQSDKSQRITPIATQPVVVRKLQGLIHHRSELVAECVQRKNKLTAICDELFPEFTNIYKDPNSPSALNLREKFATPQAVAAASIEELCKTRMRTFPGRLKLEDLKKLASSSIGTRDENRLYSHTLEQKQLIIELRLLETHVYELNALIEDLAINSREGQILLSMGIIGKIQAGILIAGIGNIANFESASKLRGYFGWIPRSTQTGTTMDRVSLQTGGNKLLKQTIYMVVMKAVQPSGGAWSILYSRLVERKCNLDERTGRYKGKMKVIGRIAGQLIGMIYFLLKKDYDLLQGLEPGKPLPPPMLYDSTKHKVKALLIEPVQ